MNARIRLVALAVALLIATATVSPALAGHGNAPGPLEQAIINVSGAITNSMGTAGLPGQPTLGQVGGTAPESGSYGTGSGSSPSSTGANPGGGGGGGGGGGEG